MSRRVHRYKRIARFQEWIRFLSGGSEAPLPKEFLVYIWDQMQRHGVTNPTDTWVGRQCSISITYAKMRCHSARVAALFGSFCPLCLSDIEREKIMHLFTQCSDVWPTVKKRAKEEMSWDRATFINYNFILHQLLIRIGCGKKAAAHTGPRLIRTPEILCQQQALWVYTCHELGWEPTGLTSSVLSKESMAVPLRRLTDPPPATAARPPSLSVAANPPLVQALKKARDDKKKRLALEASEASVKIKRKRWKRRAKPPPSPPPMTSGVSMKDTLKPSSLSWD